MLFFIAGLCVVLVSSLERRDDASVAKMNQRRILHSSHHHHTEAEREALLEAIREVLDYEAQHPDAAAAADDAAAAMAETTETPQTETSSTTSTTTTTTTTTSTSSTPKATTSTTSTTSMEQYIELLKQQLAESNTMHSSTSSTTSTTSTSTSAAPTSTTTTTSTTRSGNLIGQDIVVNPPDIERDETTDDDEEVATSNVVDENGVKHMVLNFSTRSLINLWLIVVSVLIINAILFCCYTRSRRKRQSFAGFVHDDRLQEEAALQDI